MRLAASALLLVGSLLAQTKPDFSGTFLRVETTVGKETRTSVPRILQLTQTPEEMSAIAFQNGESAVAHYPFHRKKSDRFHAKLKGDTLVVDGTFEWRGLSTGLFGAFSVPEHVRQTWHFSADGQRLMIDSKSDSGTTSSETYLRQPSLDSARARAAAEHTTCENDPAGLWIRKNLPGGKYEGGIFLGHASFAQITRCVGYSADISGDSLKGVEIDENAKPPRFLRLGKPVSTYPGDVLLKVQPEDNHSCSTSEPWVSTGTNAPEPVQNLRFMVRWLGESNKDLGEVPSEFVQEPWPELSPPYSFYRMQIPAEGIPLTDELEIVIFSNNGQQLACVKGHI